MMAEQGYKSLINTFTRLPENGKHPCLDHIFIKTADSKI